MRVTSQSRVSHESTVAWHFCCSLGAQERALPTHQDTTRPRDTTPPRGQDNTPARARDTTPPRDQGWPSQTTSCVRVCCVASVWAAVRRPSRFPSTGQTSAIRGHQCVPQPLYLLSVGLLCSLADTHALSLSLALSLSVCVCVSLSRALSGSSAQNGVRHPHRHTTNCGSKAPE